MKSAILHRGGSIRDEAESNTIGFSLCVGRSLSDGTIRYLTEEQAQLLRIINGLRDAEQHHLLDISEAQLYVHIQSGVTLFRDILRNVFGKDLVDYLPRRVLPISTSPPLTIEALFDTEIAEVKKLLSPGNRRHVEAFARLRSLMVVERATVGDVILPTDKELGAVAKHLVSGKPWDAVFPGASTIEFIADGSGPTLSLRISKRDGIPVQIVGGEAQSVPIALKRVDELGFYSLGPQQLAERVGLTPPKSLAVVQHLDLMNDPDCYKEIRIGKSVFKRYSPKAIERVKTALEKESIEEIWAHRRALANGSRGESIIEAHAALV